jgi:flavodoxin
MENLILYDSNYGNTRQIAVLIAVQLGRGAISVSVKELKESDLQGLKLLIVGSPINAWRPTPKITAFLKTLGPQQLKGVKATAFDTRARSFLSGNAAKKIAKALQNAGAELVTPETCFYVKSKEGPLFIEEYTKIKEWTNRIIAAL